MPSAVGAAKPAATASRPRWLARGFYSLAGLLVLLVAAAFGAGVALNAGIGLERIDRAADAQLSALFGRPVDARFSQPRISMDGVGALAVEVRDASVRLADGASIGQAKELRFVVNLASLARGRLALSGASAKGAIIDAAAFGNPGDGERPPAWMALRDPHAIARSVFSSVAALIGSLERAGADVFGFDDVTVQWGPEAAQRIVVSTLNARRSGRKLEMEARLARGELEFALDARAEMADGRDEVRDLAGSIVIPAFGEEGSSLRTGEMSISIAGSQSAGDRIGLALAPVAVNATLSGNRPIAMSVASRAEIVAGANKIELNELTVVNGLTALSFNGAVTAGDGDRPTFRYELVSDGSRLAPADSPEMPLDLVARIAGYADPGQGLFVADEIGVRTSGGEVFGTASVTLAEGLSPAAYLAINVAGLPVPQAKQLWPAFAAPSARNWVLAKLFGGNVTDGFLELKVRPGRLSEGKLTADEISGHFGVAGARFDIAGDLPPVRDAAGTIDFSGDDVKIKLDAGRVYLPSGKTVDGKGGTFDILDAARLPVTGRLDIAVSGKADAIAELASYKPINALEKLPVTPESLSGAATGRVTADIPLSKTADGYSSIYNVSLDFTDLAIAAAFDGQKISGASGTIGITPERATIKAKAKLNGIPAEIGLVEPLKPNGGERSQKIVLLVDEKTQKTLAPGLSSIVEGSFSVELAKTGTGRRTAKADLAKARINLPWVGWSKGAGVAATAEFAFETLKDGSARVSDFRLAGKSFAIAGDMVLRGDALVSGSFDKVRLNAGDDAAVSVKRNGKGYDVRLTGKSIDGRALIKDVLSDPVGAGETIGATPVSLTAEIASATGFSDEKLKDLTIVYSGTGKMVANLDIKAKTTGGGAVSITNKTKGENRAVRMESSDAGALLRFLDIYDKMRGGSISVALSGGLTGALTGDIDARNFDVINEPRLQSLVSTRPDDADKSLSEALDKKIDATRVRFESGTARITKGRGLLTIDKGILRGPLLGFSFQGTFYDPKENMAMTGTMMPAYGLNRIFGELPVIGLILGNGEDKGLIGITFRLAGKAKDPVLTVNPISLIAPGIFRSIFEFKKG